MVGDKDPEESTSATLTAFSATDAALAYFFQVRVALLLALRRLSKEQSFAAYIQTIDDVVFEPDGQAPELLQVKHHQRKPGNLTDASADLWKTIRVWIEGRNSGIIPPNAQLCLVTTADVGHGSIASKLQATIRDEAAAIARRLATASTSLNAENAPTYSLFRALMSPEREALVPSVTILPRIRTSWTWMLSFGKRFGRQRDQSIARRFSFGWRAGGTIARFGTRDQM